MGLEIERKFLVVNSDWHLDHLEKKELIQGYLSTTPRCTVRVRIEKYSDKSNSWITIKGRGQGFTRPEYEYLIPLKDAEELLRDLKEYELIEKTRHLVPCGNHTWEIDVFKGSNLGLVLAEVTLKTEDEDFSHPKWLGKEVTSDPRYLNSNLCKNPYEKWPKES